MIAEAADALIAVTEDLQSAQRSRRHGDALNHRNRILEKLLTRASCAREATTALVTRTGESMPVVSGKSAALEALRQWQSQLDSDVAAALSGNSFSTFQTATERVVAQSEARAQNAWRDYLTRTSPDINTELLDVLDADPQAAATVQQIRDLSRKLRVFADLPLPTAEQIVQYDAAVADLRSAWSTLDLSGLDDEIVAFLRAANGELGAALTTLTPGVMAWLSERGLIDYYVIRPGARR